MRNLATVLLAAGALFAQEGQEGPKPGWPCVAGRAVDPSYIELSESTGGQLFLFQKGEVAQSGAVMGASFSHPSTVVRAVGQLSGTREFDVPVDSTMQTVLVMVSLQCRNSINVFGPKGMEMTAANSTEFANLQTGQIVRIDNPEPGAWRVRLSGTGLFIFTVMAKSEIRLSQVKFAAEGEAPSRQPRLGVKQKLDAGVAGELSDVQFQLAGAAGETLAEAESADGVFSVTPNVERFRVVMTGRDAAGWPVRRVHPVLFRAERPAVTPDKPVPSP